MSSDDTMSVPDTRLHELAIAGSRLGLWDWNLQTGETVFNERWAEIVGYRLDELGPLSIGIWASLAHPDDLAASDAAIELHVSGQAPFYDVEARMRHREGHWVWIRDRGHVVAWDDAGRPLRMVGTHEDITDRVLAEQAQVARAQHIDPLTQLPNRLGFLDAFERHLADQRPARSISGLFVIDLDRFKAVNDSHGHPYGDVLLAEVANRLASVAGPADVLARLDSDQFVLLKTRMTGTQALDQFAHVIRTTLAPPTSMPDGREIYVTACIGIEAIRHDETRSVEVLQSADAALNDAKRQGPGSTRFRGADLVETHRARLDLETRLRQAWRDGLLAVHYQPQLDVITERIIGAEALLRWPQESGSFVPPDVFVPVAEATGMIREIGEWVIWEACQQGRSWTAAGLPPLTMSVNVSPLQLVPGVLVRQVAAALDGSGFPAGRLDLEITESALVETAEGSPGWLAELRELGVRFSVDDFGTGYSSFGHIHRFHLDQLKIDRSFLRDIEQDADARAICAAIIGLGRTLGMRVLAEGVETPGQLAFLREQGCDTYQGFLASPALPADAFAAWVGAAQTPTAADHAH